MDAVESPRKIPGIASEQGQGVYAAMSSELNISVSSVQGKKPVTVLHIEGSIDAGSVGALESKATELVQAGIQSLLLDMTKVGFVSSAGFRTIHKIYQAMHPDGETGGLKILNSDDHVHRLVKTLGFDRYVEVVDGSLQEAVDSF